MTNTGTQIEATAVETTAGECLLVQVDETARTVTFLDDDDQLVAVYAFDVFADVTEALALDAGRGVILTAETVAGVQQFADLDAHGLRARAAA